MLALETHEDLPKDSMTRNDGINGNLDGNLYASVWSVQIDGKINGSHTRADAAMPYACGRDDGIDGNFDGKPYASG